MTSLRARLANRYLRLTIKPKALHLIAPDELRAMFESRKVPILPRGVDLEAVSREGVRGEWQRPQDARNGRIVLYMHGGAYMFGSAGLYRSMTMPLALKSCASLFSLEYRLAPEHPCPAAIEDAVAAFEWLLNGVGAPDRIIFGGDSAGGGLVLATLQVLRALGKPMPAGAFVFSPWADLEATGASVSANALRDCMFQQSTVREIGAFYAGALDRTDPRVSPLYGDFRGLPPLLVFASRDEMLFDDARRVVEKATAVGVDVQFEPRSGLSHVWPLFYPLYPEAGEALAITADFIRVRTAIAERIAA